VSASDAPTKPPPPVVLTVCPLCHGHGTADLEQVGVSLWRRVKCVVCKGDGSVDEEFAEIWLAAWSGGEKT